MLGIRTFNPKTHNACVIQASVQFARAHNIGISVFSTGHEFNDRGGGPGNNTLLVSELTLDRFEDTREKCYFPGAHILLGLC